ncbi:LysR substrate-binding domain-containing protein [Saccharopolyspora spinosa]|uniref:LysR substrate-binding domain-containing protein n=1 Tax=Saccharopolyspora spinosa TaxID=60894 RepID=UPI001475B077|nr:LysR substrate-binding domain-containing protein [Saccharopolyspora spinosa]
MEAADRVIAELETLRTQINRSRGEISQRLRVASMQTVTFILFPEVLTRLRRRRPGLDVVIVQAEPDAALQGLQVDDYDLVIAESYPQWPVIYPDGLTTEILMTDRMHVAAAPIVGPPPVGWGQALSPLASRSPLSALQRLACSKLSRVGPDDGCGEGILTLMHGGSPLLEQEADDGGGGRCASGDHPAVWE